MRRLSSSDRPDGARQRSISRSVWLFGVHVENPVKDLGGREVILTPAASDQRGVYSELTKSLPARKEQDGLCAESIRTSGRTSGPHPPRGNHVEDENEKPVSKSTVLRRYIQPAQFECKNENGHLDRRSGNRQPRHLGRRDDGAPRDVRPFVIGVAHELLDGCNVRVSRCLKPFRTRFSDGGRRAVRYEAFGRV